MVKKKSPFAKGEDVSEITRTLFMRYEDSHNKDMNFRRKTGNIIVLGIILFFILLAWFGKTNSSLAAFLLFVLFIIISIISFIFYKKSKKYKLGEKEDLVRLLIKTSNHISNFIESNDHKELKKAIMLNSLLIRSLSAPSSLFPNTFNRKGWSFDKKLVDTLSLVRIATKKKFKAVLCNIPNDKKLRDLLATYRKLALFANNEELDNIYQFLKRKYALGLPRPSFFKKLIKSYNKSDIFRWVIAILSSLISLGLLLGLFVFLHWYTISKPSLWEILVGACGIITVVVLVKTQVIDKILDKIEIKEKTT